MKVYDKAKWHIDAGEDAKEVIERFQIVFNFLSEKGLLDEEGEEILEIGIDSSVSLHEDMVNDMGKKFLESYYDEIIGYDLSKIPNELEKRFHNL